MPGCQQGPQPAARASCSMTPTRTFIVVCVLAMCLFYALTAAFQRRMSRLEVS